MDEGPSLPRPEDMVSSRRLPAPSSGGNLVHFPVAYLVTHARLRGVVPSPCKKGGPFPLQRAWSHGPARSAHSSLRGVVPCPCKEGGPFPPQKLLSSRPLSLQPDTYRGRIPGLSLARKSLRAGRLDTAATLWHQSDGYSMSVTWPHHPGEPRSHCPGEGRHRAAPRPA
jgi:hypothetical protein